MGGQVAAVIGPLLHCGSGGYTEDTCMCGQYVAIIVLHRIPKLSRLFKLLSLCTCNARFPCKCP